MPLVYQQCDCRMRKLIQSNAGLLFPRRPWKSSLIFLQVSLAVKFSCYSKVGLYNITEETITKKSCISQYQAHILLYKRCELVSNTNYNVSAAFFSEAKDLAISR